MSRISKYQEHIRDFLKNKSFIKNVRSSTRKIVVDMLDESDYFPGILCLTIINNRCKQGGLKMHGYHLASGIEALMMVIKVLNNRPYYDSKYTTEETSNMIIDITNWFYDCINENINTMRLSNEDIDIKKYSTIVTKSINYTVKKISQITESKFYNNNSYTRMKKTDLFCLDFDDDTVHNYKKMKRLDEATMLTNIHNTYGMVCRMAVCLGWIIGMGDEQSIDGLESIADSIGLIIKIHDDFKTYKRDMKYGDVCSNFVVTHGVKEALILFDDSSIKYAEQSVSVGVETKTCGEIIKVITDFINEATQDMSVDLDTEFDDISMASRSNASNASTMSTISSRSVKSAKYVR